MITNNTLKGGEGMKMVRVLIQVPEPIKAKLDALRAQGYTAAGFIRTLLERELSRSVPGTGQKGK
jgi:mannitol/fructose-specific phosphotransferase system IIA component